MRKSPPGLSAFAHRASVDPRPERVYIIASERNQDEEGCSSFKRRTRLRHCSGDCEIGKFRMLCALVRLRAEPFLRTRSGGKVAKQLGAAKHNTVKIDLRLWGGSALTDDALEVPEASASPGRPDHLCPGPEPDLPVVRDRMGGGARRPRYFHRRQQRRLFRVSGLPPAFIESFRETARLGTCAVDEGWSYRINAPLQNLSKAQIIETGTPARRRLRSDHELLQSRFRRPELREVRLVRSADRRVQRGRSSRPDPVFRGRIVRRSR